MCSVSNLKKEKRKKEKKENASQGNFSPLLYINRFAGIIA